MAMNEKCVYIYHACGGYWFWAVDNEHVRESIKDALYKAAQSGERVEYVDSGMPIKDTACLCFMGTAAGASL